jgi:hypothetical protein
MNERTEKGENICISSKVGGLGWPNGGPWGGPATSKHKHFLFFIFPIGGHPGFSSSHPLIF